MLSLMLITTALSACGAEPDNVAVPNVESASVAPPTSGLAPATAATLPDDVEIGTAPLMPTATPSLEILGVAVGQSLPDARGAFKSSTNAGFTDYEEKLGPLPRPLQRRFLSGIIAKNMSKPGLNNQLGALLLSPPASPQVWYVGRHITYAPDEGPSVASSLKSLTDKYGPPHFVRAPDMFYWFWGSNGQPVAQPIDGDCKLKTETGTVSLYMSPPDNRAAMDPITLTKVRNICPRVVRAVIQARNDVVTSFQLGVADYAMMAKGAEQSLAVAKKSADMARDALMQKADRKAPEI